MYAMRCLMKASILLVLLASLIWAFKEPTITYDDWGQDTHPFNKVECSVVTNL